MIINRTNKNKNVKFVSYTGKYPNLCSGILTLEINGEQATFGHSKAEYPPFWKSGGNCGFRNNYSESYRNTGEWIIDESNIPEKYREYAAEIDDVFNANVEYGCCGGCL